MLNIIFFIGLFAGVMLVLIVHWIRVQRMMKRLRGYEDRSHQNRLRDNQAWLDSLQAEYAANYRRNYRRNLAAAQRTDAPETLTIRVTPTPFRAVVRRRD